MSGTQTSGLPVTGLTINGVPVEGQPEETILEVALRYGIDIPTLCYHPAVTPYASCRVCIVEAIQSGRTRVVTACTYPAREGLEVYTDSPRIQKSRRVVLELLLAQAPASEELREFAARYGVTSTRFPSLEPGNKCILCGLCERVCREQAHIGSISFAQRGTTRKLTTPFEEPPQECSGCTSCAFVCPTGAVAVRVKAGGMELDPWGAQIEMLVCEDCGARFAPAPLMAQVVARTGGELTGLALCPTCRRKAHARQLVGQKQ